MTTLPTHAFAAALEADFAAPAKTRAKPIPREAWRQEKARTLARIVIIGNYDFIAHDRAQAHGDRSHLFQWKRGVRKSLPDTQTIFPVNFVTTAAFVPPIARHAWFEFKAKGEKPDDDQLAMLGRLRTLGDFASWGVTLVDLVSFWAQCGVPLVANAYFVAMKYDGMVDSRIVRAEAERDAGAPTKKTRSYKPGPRFVAGKRMQRRAAAKGVRI